MAGPQWESLSGFEWWLEATYVCVHMHEYHVPLLFSVYVQRGNQLKRIEGLQNTKSLQVLDLSLNCITSLSGLQNLHLLGSINLEKNLVLIREKGLVDSSHTVFSAEMSYAIKIIYERRIQKQM